ncbi:MAG: hypothetical protein Kow0068_24310 [Marinilabiliales bacterium]
MNNQKILAMKLNEDIALSDNGFVFDPTSGETFSLNQTGTDIIKLLKKGLNIEEIKKALLEKYEANDYEIEKEIYDFITILKQYNLIKDNE